jgi:hypothetical protein
MDEPQKEGQTPIDLILNCQLPRKTNIIGIIGPSRSDAATIRKMLGMFSSTPSAHNTMSTMGLLSIVQPV